MKKTQKKIFGLFGLALVVAMTIFAASLPGPRVAAQSASGLIDTIVVRVIGDGPHVYFTDSIDGSSFVGSKQTVTFNYENIQTAVVTLTYNGKDGPQTYTLKTITSSGEAGSDFVNLDLSEYGYGEYVISIIGEGLEGTPAEDYAAFSYYPMDSTVEQDSPEGDPSVILDYDDKNTDINKIVINVYDENGDLVKGLSPITVMPGNKNVSLPFAENNLPTGKYRIEVIAYNKDNISIYHSSETINYQAPDEDMAVPNTGSLFGSLNVSQSDYLVTGLLIFFIAGIGGIAFILKDKRNSKR